MSTIQSPFNNIPRETILGIFSNLDARDLAICCQVSSEWRQLASDDSLWKKLFPHFPEQVLGKNQLIKKCIDANGFSLHKGLQYLEEIAKKASFSKCNRVSYYFPLHPGINFVVDFGNLKASHGEVKTMACMRKFMNTGAFISEKSPSAEELTTFDRGKSLSDSRVNISIKVTILRTELANIGLNAFFKEIRKVIQRMAKKKKLEENKKNNVLLGATTSVAVVAMMAFAFRYAAKSKPS